VPDQTLDYIIHFENKPTAGAPAQEVVITQQLDTDLDWTTFELGEFGFGDFTVQVPAGRQYFNTRVDARASVGLFADFTVDINLRTGLVTWKFSSVDPATFDLPSGALDGFLPPNVTAPQGEGFVSYRVRPKSFAVTGTRIDALATIVFDTEDPLNTPSIFNTLDAAPPTSTVDPLPTISTTETFSVSWSGSDDANGTPGSGIAKYDIFVSDNGGPFQLWLDDTTATSGVYSGEADHTYRLYSVATDHVGHEETTSRTAQTQTTVSIFDWHNVTNPRDVNADGLIAPLDAILVINELNRPLHRDPATSRLPTHRPNSAPYLDVSRDKLASPIDAILVINYLNHPDSPEGESLAGNVAAGLLDVSSYLAVAWASGDKKLSGAREVDPLGDRALTEFEPRRIRELDWCIALLAADQSSKGALRASLRGKNTTDHELWDDLFTSDEDWGLRASPG
jgi:hypothetical protein